jgi:hypothetical protein
MIMRFHWGLAVGHVYSHGDSSNTTGNTVGCSDKASIPEEAPDTTGPDTIEETYVLDERREYSLEDCDHVDWDEGSDRNDDLEFHTTVESWYM